MPLYPYKITKTLGSYFDAQHVEELIKQLELDCANVAQENERIQNCPYKAPEIKTNMERRSTITKKNVGTVKNFCQRVMEFVAQDPEKRQLLKNSDMVQARSSRTESVCLAWDDATESDENFGQYRMFTCWFLDGKLTFFCYVNGNPVSTDFSFDENTTALPKEIEKHLLLWCE